MQYYIYRAISTDGAIERGGMAALNTSDLEARLGRSGLELINCRHSLLALVNGKKSFSRNELISFTFHVEQLLRAGVPLREVLVEYRDNAEKPHLRSIASTLVDSIDSGQQFSKACSECENSFDKMYRSMLEVGEQSGNLDTVLADLGELLKWQDETVSRVRRALIYPSFVAVVLLLVIVFVMVWLVPGLLSFVTSTGSELQWHTKALIATSDFVGRYWILVISVSGGAVLLARVAVTSRPQYRMIWHRLVLSIPLIGPVLRSIKFARFSRCAALMYSSGVGLIETMKLGEHVVDNLHLSSAIRGVRQRIVEGESISNSFGESLIFPPLLKRMVRVGEATGEMDTAFSQVAYFYDRESRETIEKLEQFIGPLMIMVVGAIMMWVVISVIGPIYDLVFSLQESF